jgi:hypothetical protein
MPYFIKCYFNIQEHCSGKNVIVEIWCGMVHKPQTLCRAVTGTEIKLSCIASFLNVHLDYFQDNSSNSSPVVDKRLIGRKFWENFGSLESFGNVRTFVSFRGFGKWDSLKQWLNECVRCTSGFLERCLRHSFGTPSSPQAFLSFNVFTNFCVS